MKKRGRGVAGTVYPTGGSMTGGMSGAYVHVRDDGSVNLSSGCTELGQGLNTAMAQILAEELGIPVEEITVISGDTETCPFDVGAVASRQTHFGGNAVRAAAEEVKKILAETASQLLDVDPEALRFKGGLIYVSGHPDRCVPFRKAVSVTMRERRIPLIAEGWHVANTSKAADPETGKGEPFAAYEYQAVVADIEVDTETGQVEVLNLYAALESGRIINPLLAEGQTEGGMMMGVGFGLRETLFPYYPESDILPPDCDAWQQNTNLADYLVGTSEDVPFLKESLVDCPDPAGPYGAVGIGEFSANCVGVAIANAIHDAVGVRILNAPCMPERVLAALKRNEEAL